MRFILSAPAVVVALSCVTLGFVIHLNTSDVWKNMNRDVLSMRRFVELGLNEDGIYSAEEALSEARRYFDVMDIDGDGAVSGEEYINAGTALVKVPQTEHYLADKRRREKVLREMIDRDQDGDVSLEEFEAFRLGIFERADPDGDGQVTPREYLR